MTCWQTVVDAPADRNTHSSLSTTDAASRSASADGMAPASRSSDRACSCRGASMGCCLAPRLFWKSARPIVIHSRVTSLHKATRSTCSCCGSAANAALPCYPPNLALTLKKCRSLCICRIQSTRHSASNEVHVDCCNTVGCAKSSFHWHVLETVLRAAVSAYPHANKRNDLPRKLSQYGSSLYASSCHVSRRAPAGSARRTLSIADHHL